MSVLAGPNERDPKQTEWCYARRKSGHTFMCCAGVGDHSDSVYCKCCPDGHADEPAPPEPCAQEGCKCFGRRCIACGDGQHEAVGTIGAARCPRSYGFVDDAVEHPPHEHLIRGVPFRCDGTVVDG